MQISADLYILATLWWLAIPLQPEWLRHQQIVFRPGQRVFFFLFVFLVVVVFSVFFFVFLLFCFFRAKPFHYRFRRYLSGSNLPIKQTCRPALPRLRLIRFVWVHPRLLISCAASFYHFLQMEGGGEGKNANHPFALVRHTSGDKRRLGGREQVSVDGREGKRPGGCRLKQIKAKH